MIARLHLAPTDPDYGRNDQTDDRLTLPMGLRQHRKAYQTISEMPELEIPDNWRATYALG